MSHFTLTTGTSVGTTSISNIFLDEYMPGANGAHAKVSLYMLRSIVDSTSDLSVIVRQRYWTVRKVTFSARLNTGKSRDC